MNLLRRSLLPVLVPVLAAALWPAPAKAANPLVLAPCKIGPVEAKCGSYPVWEDREARSGRKLDLSVVVLPSHAATPLADPFVFIAGGPGDTSTRSAVGLADSPLRAERDILLVDLRGTGGSAPLRCAYQDDPARPARYLADLFPIGELRRCLEEELRKRADVRLYTTPIAVDDLDEVRQALGYGKLNLMGASYGTRAVLVYMQRHPRQVRSAILHAPAPTNAAMPLSFAVDADNALESLLADCRADAGCQSRFPDSRTNLFRVLDALEAKPVTAEVPHPATGKPVPVQLNRAAFAQLVRYMLYVPSWAARIPLVIDSAGRGDFEEAGAMALLIGSALGRASDALYAAVTCTEDVPFFERETGRLLAAGTFLGPLRVDLQKELCNGWPRGSLPTDYREPLRSDVPTLLLVGERDPSTPSRWARSIAAQLPNSRLVIVPDGGHDFDGLSGAGCLDDLQNRFVREASFASIDLSCLETTSHPPFALAKESKVAVELTGETLARLAGTYGGAGQGPQIRIAREDGQLFAIAGDQRFQLAASSSLEFTIPGAPGLKFVFEERQGKVIALRFIEGGGEGTRLARIEE